jgi:hypothetical protein
MPHLHSLRRPKLALVREPTYAPYGSASFADCEPPEGAHSHDRAESDRLDAIFDLGEEIATLAAYIHAATQRLLVMIAEFDRARGWESDARTAGLRRRWGKARIGQDETRWDVARVSQGERR